MLGMTLSSSYVNCLAGDPSQLRKDFHSELFSLRFVSVSTHSSETHLKRTTGLQHTVIRTNGSLCLSIISEHSQTVNKQDRHFYDRSFFLNLFQDIHFST